MANRKKENKSNNTHEIMDLTVVHIILIKLFFIFAFTFPGVGGIKKIFEIRRSGHGADVILNP